MIRRPQTLQLFTQLSTPRLSRMSSSVSGMGLRYAEGEDEAAVQRGVEALTGQGWELDGERMGVQKTYYFRSYFKAIVRLSAGLSSRHAWANNTELCQHDCGGERRQKAPRGYDGGKYVSRWLDLCSLHSDSGPSTCTGRRINRGDYHRRTSTSRRTANRAPRSWGPLGRRAGRSAARRTGGA